MMQSQKSQIGSRVSVICPVYNSEPFLERHITSVIKTLGSKVELIYVDNNSSDSSLDTLKRLALKHPNVSIYQCFEQGVSHARNFALSHARGDVLVFLDSDDYFLSKEAVLKQIALARIGQPSFCRTALGETGESAPVWKTEDKLNFYLNFGNQVPFSSFVCPNSDLRFAVDLKTSEDWLYVVEARKLFGKVALVDEIGRYYSLDTGYSSQILDEVKFETHCKVFALHYGLAPSLARYALCRLYGFPNNQRERLASKIRMISKFHQIFHLTHIPKILRILA